MQNDFRVRVAELGDRDLLARLKRCVVEERLVTGRLLEHFAEVDARGLYRELGFSSMFDYAVHGLHMSESEAGLRITVSRLVRRFPQALELFSRGEVHLTALRLLAPRLTADNVHLLQQARFKSKHEVLELIARHFPQPDVSDSIRRLPGQKSAVPVVQSSLPLCAAPASLNLQLHSAAVALDVPAMVGTARGLAMPNSVSASAPAPVSATAPAPASATASAPASGASAPESVATRQLTASSRCEAMPRAARLLPVSVPLSEGRFKVQFTAGKRLHDKLRQARELMRHRGPHGDLAIVLERAVDLLIAERKKQLFGKAAKSRRPSPSKPFRNSRYVPRAIRRELAQRADEQCTFVAPNGRRCTSRGRLEVDHRVPYACGGSTTAENLRLLCRSHNLLMAEPAFGRSFMRERIECAQQARANLRSRTTAALDSSPRIRMAPPDQHVPERATRTAPQPSTALDSSPHVGSTSSVDASPTFQTVP